MIIKLFYIAINFNCNKINFNKKHIQINDINGIYGIYGIWNPGKTLFDHFLNGGLGWGGLGWWATPTRKNKLQYIKHPFDEKRIPFPTPVQHKKGGNENYIQ